MAISTYLADASLPRYVGIGPTYQKEEKMICKDCEAWDDINSRTGFCRKHAPKILWPFLEQHQEESSMYIGQWPITDSFDWCMEFIERAD